MYAKSVFVYALISYTSCVVRVTLIGISVKPSRVRNNVINYLFRTIFHFTVNGFLMVCVFSPSRRQDRVEFSFLFCFVILLAIGERGIKKIWRNTFSRQNYSLPLTGLPSHRVTSAFYLD